MHFKLTVPTTMIMNPLDLFFYQVLVQVVSYLLEHGLDPMYRLGRHGLGLALLCCLKGRGQIHQALDLGRGPELVST